MKLLLTVLIPCLVFVSGCANKGHAVFVTKTSLSIVDVDTAPSGISFGYQRTEGYVGPSLEDGHVVPVVGYLRSDGSLLARGLTQVYAAGCASEIVVNQKGWQPPLDSSCMRSPDPGGGLVIFTAGTNLGLAFHFTEGSAPGMNLGYRRKEASLLPVRNGAVPSVIAMHEHGASAQNKDARPEGRANVTQFFATGVAADALARNEQIRSGFDAGARDAFQAYFEQEGLQKGHALATLSCLSRLPDTALPDIHANLRELDIPWLQRFEQDAAAAPDAARVRASYTRYLAIPDPADQQLTLRLSVHRSFVCGRANALPGAPQ